MESAIRKKGQNMKINQYLDISERAQENNII